MPQDTEFDWLIYNRYAVNKLRKNQDQWDSWAKNPEFIKALCALSTKDGPDKNISALYRLSIDKEGIELLSKIPLDWYELCKHEAFVKALCAIREECAGDHHNTSTLYWLSSNIVEGRSLLSKMSLDWNVICKHEDFVKALCTLITERNVAEFRNVSLLYWLAATNNRNELLIKMPLDWGELCKHEDFVKALCALRTYDGEYNNTSALYWLSANNDSRELLSKIPFDWNALCEREDFIQALCALRTNAGELNNTSALYWLSTSKEGIELLSKIPFDWNALCERESFVKALCALRVDGVGPNKNISTLAWLSGTVEGIELLSNMSLEWNKLCKHEDFVKAVCVTIIEGILDVKNASVLYFCIATHSVDVIPILRQISKYHTVSNQYFNDVSVKPFCIINASKDDEFVVENNEVGLVLDGSCDMSSKNLYYHNCAHYQYISSQSVNTEAISIVIPYKSKIICQFKCMEDKNTATFREFIFFNAAKLFFILKQGFYPLEQFYQYGSKWWILLGIAKDIQQGSFENVELDAIDLIKDFIPCQDVLSKLYLNIDVAGEAESVDKAQELEATAH